MTLCLTLVLMGQLELGTGRSGPLTVVGQARINSYGTLDVDAVAGATELTSSAPFLTPQQLVLLYLNREPNPVWDGGIDIQVSQAGRFQFVRVLAASGARVTIDRPIERPFSANDSQIISVPEYEDVAFQQSSLVDARSFDGRTGGVVVLVANGTVTGAAYAKVDVTERGFPGAAPNLAYDCALPLLARPSGDAVVAGAGARACGCLSTIPTCSGGGGGVGWGGWAVSGSPAPRFLRQGAFDQMLLGSGGVNATVQSSGINVTTSQCPSSGGGVIIVRARSTSSLLFAASATEGGGGSIDVRTAGQLSCQGAQAFSDNNIGCARGSGGVIRLEGAQINCLTNVVGGTSQSQGDVLSIVRPAPLPVGSLTVTAPAQNALVNRPRPLVVGAAAASALVDLLVDTEALASTTADAMGNFTLSPERDLADGVVTLRVRTGSTEVLRTLTIDTVPPPPPTLDSPADGSATASGLPGFSGHAPEAVQVVLFVDGARVGTDVPDGQARWQLALDAEHPLEKGLHQVVLTAFDRAGNQSETDASFQVGRTLEDPKLKVSGACSTGVGAWAWLVLVLLRRGSRVRL